MSQTSNRLLLGLGLLGLVLDGIASHPAFAVDKTELFKVVTNHDEIVIGLSKSELKRLEARNADDVAKQLARLDLLNVWQYGVRKSGTGGLEQAPLRRIGVTAASTVRVEPFETPLRIVPVNLDMTGQ